MHFCNPEIQGFQKNIDSICSKFGTDISKSGLQLIHYNNWITITQTTGWDTSQTYEFITQWIRTNIAMWNNQKTSIVIDLDSALNRKMSSWIYLPLLGQKHTRTHIVVADTQGGSNTIYILKYLPVKYMVGTLLRRHSRPKLHTYCQSTCNFKSNMIFNSCYTIDDMLYYYLTIGKYYHMLPATEVIIV